ncbi:MAG TPA: hypothetical protein PLU55_00585 [Candidatus Pacearchaeota archaeon]|nr:hypothetical protein [Candidatus Pacearchaeota archaeon]
MYKDVFTEKTRINPKAISLKLQGYTCSHPVLTEAVIRPNNYAKMLTNYFDYVCKRNKNKLEKGLPFFLFELNKRFREYNVIFEIENIGSPYNQRGIHVMSTSTSTGKTIVKCNYKLLESLENKESYNRLLHDFFVLIGHELIHRGQFYYRKYKELLSYAYYNETNYFEDKDEIMAYAWCIVEELRFGGYNNADILKMVSESKKFTVIKKYSDVFKNIEEQLYHKNKKLFNLFLKYLYEYIKGNHFKNQIIGLK